MTHPLAYNRRLARGSGRPRAGSRFLLSPAVFRTLGLNALCGRTEHSTSGPTQRGSLRQLDRSNAWSGGQGFLVRHRLIRRTALTGWSTQQRACARMHSFCLKESPLSTTKPNQPVSPSTKTASAERQAVKTRLKMASTEFTWWLKGQRQLCLIIGFLPIYMFHDALALRPAPTMRLFPNCSLSKKYYHFYMKSRWRMHSIHLKVSKTLRPCHLPRGVLRRICGA